MKKNLLAKSPGALDLSFIPSIIQKEYAHNPDRNKDHVIMGKFGTLLWIDLCNFSPLCNRLMEDNLNGVEKISNILNGHYDFILNVIHRYGGDPLYFAGDGLMSAWFDDSEKAEESVRLALACGNYVLKNRFISDDRRETLSLHVIISHGPIQIAELEGIRGNRLLTFFGKVFYDLKLTAKNRAPNQLLVHNSTLPFLMKDLEIEPVANNSSIIRDFPFISPPPQNQGLEFGSNALIELRDFIPNTLVLPLSKEYLQWIAEIRPVSVVFVRLPNKGIKSIPKFENTDKISALINPVVLKYQGLINQIWIDEKDSNILICFGPPPSAHVDNPERSVHLAFEIHNFLKKSGFSNSIGVSTGMAYCGILGNDILRHYTVIGDVVNLSSRLSGLKNDIIICDEATFKATRKTIKFNGPIEGRIKGKDLPISWYLPKAVTMPSLLSKQEFSIGRAEELKILADAALEAIKGINTCILIEGDSGMGKTKLLEDFRKSHSQESFSILFFSGDFLLRQTPFGALGIIFSYLLGLTKTDPNAKDEELMDNLELRFGNRACLLNSVLPLNIPESEEIQKMAGNLKVKATHELLFEILEYETVKKSLILLVDDAQWIDSNTRRLLESVTNSLPKTMLVMALQKTEANLFLEGFKLKNIQKIILKELALQDLETLTLSKLGISQVSTPVMDIIQKTSKGNPFYCIELIGFLYDQKLLKIENNSCQLATDLPLKDLLIPETIRGAIFNKMDQLEPGAQLTLKVGSVVGNRFGRGIVKSVYPITGGRRKVPSYLSEAKQFGFINEDTVDNLPGYNFSNDTILKVAYEMTLSEQKKFLHMECAKWYEKKFKANLFSYYYRLAHHWENAGDLKRASRYYALDCIRLFKLGYAASALDIGLYGVKLLYPEIENDPQILKGKIGEYFGAIASYMESKSIDSLIEHKKLKDENMAIVIKNLLDMGPPAFVCQKPEIFVFMVLICTRLTLEQGYGEHTASVFSFFSIIYKAITKDSLTAYAWSELAMNLDQKKQYTSHGRVAFIHCWFIALWIVPLKKLIPLPSVASKQAFLNGDIIFGCDNISLEVILIRSAGFPLSEVVLLAEQGFTKNTDLVLDATFHLKQELQMAKAYQGKTVGYTSLTDQKFDEERDIASICSTDLFNQIGYYHVFKMVLNVHFGNWKEALIWGDQSLAYLPAFENQPGHIDLEQFYTIAALYQAYSSDSDVHQDLLNKALKGIETIKQWSLICPENFEHKALLVEGIREGLAGNTVQALSLLERSADKAKTEGFLPDVGLAYEHMVRIEVGNARNPGQFLNLAFKAYQAWGADGKNQYLKETFSSYV